jgi:hypothetical protein
LVNSKWTVSSKPDKDCLNTATAKMLERATLARWSGLVSAKEGEEEGEGEKEEEEGDARRDRACLA